MKTIIFNSEMVKAILDGKKTQTRRVIKPQPEVVYSPFRGREPKYFIWKDERIFIEDMPLYCPYGQVGDRLWVRETCKIMDFGDHKGVVAYKTTTNPDELTKNVKWTPSIHMPRWASRITLETTEVRVERVQEISEEDAKAEGLRALEHQIWWQGYREIDWGELGKELMHQQTIGESPPDWMIEPHRMLDRPDIDAIFSARSRFIHLWDSINAKRGYGWEVNPWVWVILFKVV